MRGLYDERPGRWHPPEWVADRMLCFRYDGADGVIRRLTVYFSRQGVVSDAAGPGTN